MKDRRAFVCWIRLEPALSWRRHASFDDETDAWDWLTQEMTGAEGKKIERASGCVLPKNLRPYARRRVA